MPDSTVPSPRHLKAGRRLKRIGKGLTRRGRLLGQVVAPPKRIADRLPEPVRDRIRTEPDLPPTVERAWSGSRPPGSEALPDRLLASPVFVFSSIRSGSTLLRVLLDSHSKIYAPHEMHIRTLQVKYGRDFTAPAMNALGYIKRDLEALLWDRVLRHTLDRSGKEILVDKTPANVLMWRHFRRIWPQARYIFLIRDPAAIVSSVSSRRSVVDLDDIHSEVGRYCAKIEEARTELSGITIGYEDLTADPDRETRRICDYLGVDWEPEMLEYGSKDHGNYRPQLGDWSEKIRSGKIHPAQPVQSGPPLPDALAHYAKIWGYRVATDGQLPAQSADAADSAGSGNETNPGAAR